MTIRFPAESVRAEKRDLCEGLWNDSGIRQFLSARCPFDLLRHRKVRRCFRRCGHFVTPGVVLQWDRGLAPGSGTGGRTGKRCDKKPRRSSGKRRAASS